MGRRRVTSENSGAASSLKLRYVNHKNGSSSEDSEFDSLCLSDTGLAALADGFPKLEKLRVVMLEIKAWLLLDSVASNLGI
ncbi:unnamed protein product [Lathyrus sativus]|nr:unnamed protein product [Lathyrus sativus]CAK8087422.1 unnamed protein product [Lathyrus sativus]